MIVFGVTIVSLKFQYSHIVLTVYKYNKENNHDEDDANNKLIY